jgi:hypothetical protein
VTRGLQRNLRRRATGCAEHLMDLVYARTTRTHRAAHSRGEEGQRAMRRARFSARAAVRRSSAEMERCAAAPIQA